MKKLIYGLLAAAMLVFCTCIPKEEAIGSIYGTVLDKESGDPVRNAEITLTPGSKTTVVGSNGSFEFIDLEAGQYTVAVEAAGYDRNSKKVMVYEGTCTTCDFHLAKTKISQVLEVTPSSLDFGTTQTQMSVTISNKGDKETEWTLDLGNAKWLSASPLSGRIGAEKSQTIVFEVDRSLVSKETSAVVSLAAFGNSYPITVACAVKQSKAEMSIEPGVLDFGEEETSKSFTISNTGDADLAWNVKNLKETCLTLSESEGNLKPGTNKVVQVGLDREKMTSDLNTSFVITDGSTDKEIQVKATHKVKSAEMSLSTSYIDFGENETTRTFTISNTGNADLDWSLLNTDIPFLSFSSKSGVLTPGSSKTITIRLDRNTMTESIDATILASDGTNEFSIRIVADYVVLAPNMVLSPKTIDFGKDETVKTFAISNTGNADLYWEVTSSLPGCITLSQTSGVVWAGGSQNVQVSLNRELMQSDINTAISISDGTRTERLVVVATKPVVEDYSSAEVISCDGRVDVQIVSCKRNGSELEFNYTLTNNGLGPISDLRIFFPNKCNLSGYEQTIIYDNLGNEYDSYKYTFRGEIYNNSSSTYNRGITDDFPEALPCKASLSVSDFSPNAKSINIKLSVCIYDYGVNPARKYIYFKNVPIY